MLKFHLFGTVCQFQWWRGCCLEAGHHWPWWYRDWSGVFFPSLFGCCHLQDLRMWSGKTCAGQSGCKHPRFRYLECALLSYVCNYGSLNIYTSTHWTCPEHVLPSTTISTTPSTKQSFSFAQALSAPNGVDAMLFVMRSGRITDDVIARRWAIGSSALKNRASKCCPEMSWDVLST